MLENHVYALKLEKKKTINMKMVPDDGGLNIGAGSLADWTVEGGNILPPDERQLHSK